MFSPVCDCAGNVDLNKSYWNPNRKLRVTTHFSWIISEKALKYKAMYGVFSQIEA